MTTTEETAARAFEDYEPPEQAKSGTHPSGRPLRAFEDPPAGETSEAPAPERDKPKQWIWPEDRFEPAQHLRTVYAVTAPPGLIPNDLRDPTVFGAMASKFRRWDIIEVRGHDGDFFAVGLVERATPSEVQLRLRGPGLGVTEIMPEGGGLDDEDGVYRISYFGEVDRFCVVRKSDAVVMAKGFANVDSARLERERIHGRSR